MSTSIQYLIADGSGVSLSDLRRTFSSTGASGPAGLNVTFNNITANSSLIMPSGSTLYLGTGTTGANAKFAVPIKGNVTQTPSIWSAVTSNQTVGTITTVSSSLAAASATGFAVNNNNVSSSSVVLATLENYSGTYATNGFPLINISNVTGGSFNVEIINAHASNALNGILEVSYFVLS